jgi:hypothetical protein
MRVQREVSVRITFIRLLELRSYLKIAVPRVRNASECQSELVEALSDRALQYRTVARWIEALNRGREASAYLQRNGRPMSFSYRSRSRIGAGL